MLTVIYFYIDQRKFLYEYTLKTQYLSDLERFKSLIDISVNCKNYETMNRGNSISLLNHEGEPLMGFEVDQKGEWMRVGPYIAKASEYNARNGELTLIFKHPSQANLSSNFKMIPSQCKKPQ